MHRNPSVNVHQFAMVPRAEIPRSSFRMQKALKTTFDAGFLIPIFCEEILPGDTFNVRATMFGRLATPIAPVMDNLHLDSFFFFVPNRLTWSNWVRFQGEQFAPGDSTDYTIPQVVSPVGGFAPLSPFDYFGLPVSGQVDPTGTISVSALPFRAFNMIYNQWFRDENLVLPLNLDIGDGPDPFTYFNSLARRGKRHDYFTSALPFLQKGDPVTLPLGTTAPVISSGSGIPTFTDTVSGLSTGSIVNAQAGPEGLGVQLNAGGAGGLAWDATRLVADLSTATAATINQIRQAFQIQKLLERDARGGTRYTEIVRAHFGVMSPDARLQRPEYLGGGSSPINIHPIAQTSGSPGAGGYTDTPQGNLAAMGTMLASGHGFTQSFTEHGYVIGMVSVRADLTYQQGLRRHWKRATRYDYYLPVFAALGEQAILQQEIYCTGIPAADGVVFGYQERWAEMRYTPSEITGLFRSTGATPIDFWHLAQNFTAAPTLNEQFILENPPVERITAVGAAANGQQLLLDCFFDIKAARPLPMYSVPGLVDHF